MLTDNERTFDELTLGYIGISKFLKQYGRTADAVEFVRKRLAVEERLALAKPENVRWLNVANCLFDLTNLCEDVEVELGRLDERFSSDAMAYIRGALTLTQRVAERRKAERIAKLPDF